VPRKDVHPNSSVTAMGVNNLRQPRAQAHSTTVRIPALRVPKTEPTQFHLWARQKPGKFASDVKLAPHSFWSSDAPPSPRYGTTQQFRPLP